MADAHDAGLEVLTTAGDHCAAGAHDASLMVWKATSDGLEMRG